MTPDPSSCHEVYALRYGTSRSRRTTRYHRYDARFDDGDAEMEMDFYFWLVRNEHRTVLVDCGFSADQTAFPHYRHDTHPIKLLSRMGVAPEDVEHIVLTHMHFDHVGNVGLFPNARFTMARAELEFWTGPLGRKPDIAAGAIPEEVEAVQQLFRDGRLDLIDDETTLFPGVVVRPFRGHTPGQIITEVTTDSGLVVLASDAAHFYEEVEKDLPFWLFADLEGMYRGYDHLRELAKRPGVRVVVGHDPDDMNRYVRIADGCVDLTQPIAGREGAG
jgi:glyoxylase-like metal-dependent hydrolase (beta-lactamase superfamily II)